MMFRRLYWVVEEVEKAGHSQVIGVYTSIHDLIQRGLGCVDSGNGIRLTLTKLDSTKPPLGAWTSPRFERLEIDLEEYVRTDEFTEDSCKALTEELHKMYKITA